MLDEIESIVVNNEPVISKEDTIRVHHGDDFENNMLSQSLRNRMVANQEIDDSWKNWLQSYNKKLQTEQRSEQKPWKLRYNNFVLAH